MIENVDDLDVLDSDDAAVSSLPSSLPELPPAAKKAPAALALPALLNIPAEVSAKATAKAADEQERMRKAEGEIAKLRAEVEHLRQPAPKNAPPEKTPAPEKNSEKGKESAAETVAAPAPQAQKKPSAPTPSPFTVSTPAASAPAASAPVVSAPAVSKPAVSAPAVSTPVVSTPAAAVNFNANPALASTSFVYTPSADGAAQESPRIGKADVDQFVEKSGDSLASLAPVLPEYGLQSPLDKNARESALSLVDLAKSFFKGNLEVKVLDGIDLEVPLGDFVALMGPSGSGKSTLLHLIAGLDRPTAGSLKVAGSDLGSMSEEQLSHWRARNIGFIFQHYNLMAALTALENVALPLLLRKDIGKKARIERAKTALRVVGLEDRMEYKPRELSGGQEQRVAIARAIVTDPLILICDEPTGDLDRESADAVLELLVKLNRDFHKTIFMVTHDPEAAARARSKRVLSKGRLI